MDARDKALLNLIDHPVFVIEPDNTGQPRYVAFNQRACKVVDSPEEAICGRTARELYPGRLGDIAYKHHMAALADGRARAYEILLPIRGMERRIQTTLQPVHDEVGRTIRLIGSSRDMSSEQVLSEMQAGVDAMGEEMQEFVHMAAHDLRAPMRQVSTIADLLRDGFQDLGDGKLQLIDMLEGIGSKAMSLIADVLSHAQATSTGAHVTTFDFQSLAAEVMALVDPFGRCRCDIPEGHVHGDRSATLIILRNLVDNAVKHAVETNNGDGLRLAIRLEDHADGSFRVLVRDNGCGFSDPATIFLSGGTLRIASGFGLLGVRRLINARGGSITARNVDDGLGAEIAFALPGRVVSFAGEGCDVAA